MAHQILISQYYFPSIFQEVYKHVRSYQPCKFFTGKQRLAALPLQPVVIEALFQQWGVEFIDEFKHNLSNGNKLILEAIDCFTKWVELIPTNKDTTNVITYFLEDKIITHWSKTPLLEYPRD